LRAFSWRSASNSSSDNDSNDPILTGISTPSLPH
jgi:hypothetical protein